MNYADMKLLTEIPVDEKAGFDKNIRGEKLSLKDFLKLSEEF